MKNLSFDLYSVFLTLAKIYLRNIRLFGFVVQGHIYSYAADDVVAGISYTVNQITQAENR